MAQDESLVVSMADPLWQAHPEWFESRPLVQRQAPDYVTRADLARQLQAEFAAAGPIIRQMIDESLAAHERNTVARLASPGTPRTLDGQLHVKDLTETRERRELYGTATSSRTDLIGDQVIATGLRWSLPLPLLMQHDPTQIVGRVEDATAHADHIEFRACIPKSDRPGPVAERLEAAWESLRLGLISACSIGFTPDRGKWEQIKGADGAPTGGLRFLGATWNELSLVSCGANPDAKVSLIRSQGSSEIAEMRRSIAELSERLAAFEAKLTPDYKGAWRHGFEAARGDAVTADGALWIATAPTGERPGQGATAWRLIVKAPRAR
jgi:phage head maturation protease